MDGKTGIIAKDVEDYQAKLKYLMNNPQKLDEMAKNTKEYARDFSPNKIISKWIELLK